MLKLYYAPGTCALASHIALAEADAPYTTERLDFKSNQQRARHIWRSIRRDACRLW